MEGSAPVCRGVIQAALADLKIKVHKGIAMYLEELLDSIVKKAISKGLK